MSNDLIPLDQLPSTSLAVNDGVYEELAKGADFLQRLQLFTKGKAIDKGLIRPGHYGVAETGDEITDLGDTIDLLFLARRPKALDMSDREAIITSFDPESTEFKRIAAQSMEKESNCMYGPDFLVFERTTGKFYDFYCGTKSTRGEAKKMYPFLPLTAAEIAARKLDGIEPHGPLPATLKSRLVEKGSFSWHVPVVSRCSTPFANLPSSENIVKQITKFLTVKDEGPEKVQESEGKKKRAR
jgi:hypothetical protein